MQAVNPIIINALPKIIYSYAALADIQSPNSNENKPNVNVSKIVPTIFFFVSESSYSLILFYLYN